MRCIERMGTRCGTPKGGVADHKAYAGAKRDEERPWAGAWCVWVRAVGRWLAVRRHLVRMGASDETLVDAVAGWGAYGCALRDVGGGSGGDGMRMGRWVGRCGVVLWPRGASACVG